MPFSTRHSPEADGMAVRPVCAWLSMIVFAALVVFLQGCTFTGVQRPAADSKLTTPFVPPSAVPQSTATSAAIQVTPARPTPTVPCQDGLSYVADLTIPDGSVIAPGASIDKRWEVKNTGSCNWEVGYTLRLIAGDAFGAAVEQALIPARAGTNAVIRILFEAPLDPGSYRSAWQAYNPGGDPFGDPIYMEITVETP